MNERIFARGFAELELATLERKSIETPAWSPRRRMFACRRAAAIVSMIAVSTSFSAAGQDVAGALGVPQINAFLPDRNSVAATQALPIDGVWIISSIRKRIRIEQGRAYALDPWVHLFTLKIQPGMVVLRNFRRVSAGKYSADDLPLLGPATMTLTPDGNLDVFVQGTLGPAKYSLLRLEPQFPAALKAEIAAANGGAAGSSPAAPLPGMPSTPAVPVSSPQPQNAPAPAPASAPAPAPAPVQSAPPPPLPAGCKPIGIDPETGATVCA